MKLTLARMTVLVLVALAGVPACGPARSSTGVQVEIVTAPDGTRCYAFVQEGEVRGGSCER